MPRWEAIVLGLSVAGMAGWCAGSWNRATTGFIVVTTEPPDATVLVDNVKVGDHSPVKVERSAGPYTVSVLRDGYDRQDQTVEVGAGRDVATKVTLAVAADTGFELTSEPPGGLIRLDGLPLLGEGGIQARTNYRALAIRPGLHVLEIRGDRFQDWRLELQIEPGLLRKVHAVLVPVRWSP